MDFPNPIGPIEGQTPELIHAMLVWGESRGEPSDGQCAVAHIPLTRAKITGKDLKHECLRPFAFSCFNQTDPNRHKLLRPAENSTTGTWVRCWRIALEARLGQSANPAPEATHYVTKALWNRPAVNPAYPKWFEAPLVSSGKTKLVAEIGGQVFATTPWSPHD